MCNLGVNKKKGRIKEAIIRQGLSKSPIIDNYFALFYNSTGSLPEAEAMTLMMVKWMYSLFEENYPITDKYWRVTIEANTDRKKVLSILGGYERMEKDFGSQVEVQKMLVRQRRKICEALQKYEVGKLFSEEYNNSYAYAYRVTESKEEAKDVASKSFHKLLEMDNDKFFAIRNLQPYLYRMIFFGSLNEKKQNQKFISIVKDIEGEDLFSSLFSREYLETTIQAVLNCMKPPRYAEILRLYYWENNSHESIVHKMGLNNIGLSKTLLSRARKAFSKLYESPYSPDDDPGSVSRRPNQESAKKQNDMDWPGQNGGTGNGDITDFVVLDYPDLENEILAGYAEMIKDFGREDAVYTMLENEKRKLAKQLFGEMDFFNSINIFPTPKVDKLLQENKSYIDIGSNKLVEPEIMFLKANAGGETTFREIYESAAQAVFNNCYQLKLFYNEKERSNKQQASLLAYVQETTAIDNYDFVYYSAPEERRTKGLIYLFIDQEEYNRTLDKTGKPGFDFNPVYFVSNSDLNSSYLAISKEEEKKIYSQWN